jgi:hypothetical protein
MSLDVYIPGELPLWNWEKRANSTIAVAVTFHSHHQFTNSQLDANVIIHEPWYH